jgi:hypothetical protein
MATFFFTKCIGPKVNKLSGLLTLQHQVGTHVLVRGGRKLSPKVRAPRSRHTGSRDSESMEATWRRAATLLSGSTTPGLGYQQNEHIAFEDAI